jgi:hypothetical protein
MQHHTPLFLFVTATAGGFQGCCHGCRAAACAPCRWGLLEGGARCAGIHAWCPSPPANCLQISCGSANDFQYVTVITPILLVTVTATATVTVPACQPGLTLLSLCCRSPTVSGACCACWPFSVVTLLLLMRCVFVSGQGKGALLWNIGRDVRTVTGVPACTSEYSANSSYDVRQCNIKEAEFPEQVVCPVPKICGQSARFETLLRCCCCQLWWITLPGVAR